MMIMLSAYTVEISRADSHPGRQTVHREMHQQLLAVSFNMDNII